MDARLEYGVEMGVEISLRILSTVGMYNLPHSINAPIHVSLYIIFLYFVNKYITLLSKRSLYNMLSKHNLMQYLNLINR